MIYSYSKNKKVARHGHRPAMIATFRNRTLENTWVHWTHQPYCQIPTFKQKITTNYKIITTTTILSNKSQYHGESGSLTSLTLLPAGLGARLHKMKTAWPSKTGDAKYKIQKYEHWKQEPCNPAFSASHITPPRTY